MKTENNRNILGIVLVALGAALLLHNLDIIPEFMSRVVFSWQALIILIGAVMLLKNKKRSAGIIMIVIGGVFLAPEIVPLTFKITRLFWPLLMVAVGVAFILRFARKGNSPTYSKYLYTDGTEEYIDEIAIFGGNKKKLFTKAFSGGKITSIFGGVELDLSACELNFGPQFIDVITVFGGAKITVPDSWTVRMDITPIFGGFADKRFYKPDHQFSTDNVLVIKGLALFGGGEIVNK